MKKKSPIEQAKEDTIQRIKDGTMHELTDESKLLDQISKLQPIVMMDLLIEKGVITKAEVQERMDARLSEIMSAFKEMMTDNSELLKECAEKEEVRKREDRSYLGWRSQICEEKEGF